MTDLEAPVPGKGPLHGIKVVEFSQYIAAPGAGMLLADLGAEVIKVEPLSGDAARQVTTGARGLSAMFTAYNRHKRSIAIDLRNPVGRQLARELALSADVVLQNARAGAMDKLGLGAQALRAEKPGLIYASISGFGVQGPSKERPGLDIAAQAESGMMSINGETGRPPLKVGHAVIDATTSLVLSHAILAALVHRGRTGEGETINTSLLEVGVHLQQANWADYGIIGEIPGRCGNGQPTIAPAADVVEVTDGFLVISAYVPEHFKRLCGALQLGDLSSDPRFDSNANRVANRPALMELIQGAMRHMSGEDARALLESNGVVAGVVRDYAQVRASADILANQVFVPVTNSRGDVIDVPGLPYHLTGHASATPPTLADIGQHSAEVVRELGYSAEQVEELVRAGVINTGQPVPVTA